MSLMKTISQLSPAEWDNMSKAEQRQITQFLAGDKTRRAKMDKPNIENITWDDIASLTPDSWEKLDADRQAAIIAWINGQPLH